MHLNEKEEVICRSEGVAEWFEEKETETDIALVTQRLALDVIGGVAFSHDFKESDKIRKCTIFLCTRSKKECHVERFKELSLTMEKTQMLWSKR